MNMFSSGKLAARRSVTRSMTLTKAKATRGSKAGQTMPLFNPNEKDFKKKKDDNREAPKVLTRVQELRLLSKLEEAGITLSTVEDLGLLTKAENLGLVSAAVNRNTPTLVSTVALLLFAAGPATVYFVPEDSTALIALQVAVALVCTLGGS